MPNVRSELLFRRVRGNAMRPRVTAANIYPSRMLGYQDGARRARERVIKDCKRNRQSAFQGAKLTVDCLNGKPHGNRAPIVIRGRESRLHGEGGQSAKF